jgi:hypothetical protein
MDPICITIMSALATAVVAEAGAIKYLHKLYVKAKEEHLATVQAHEKLLAATLSEMKKGDKP